ncbi:UNVERIFIED_CONTAM: hypothetical protein HDU68_003288 [Siphonaria sp. JEL0065]|nr:hypothetical protein HDU68_003288 [Siphonaria sp. JEL0065]
MLPTRLVPRLHTAFRLPHSPPFTRFLSVSASALGPKRYSKKVKRDDDQSSELDSPSPSHHAHLQKHKKSFSKSTNKKLKLEKPLLPPPAPIPKPPPVVVPASKTYFPEYLCTRGSPSESFLSYYCKRFNLTVDKKEEPVVAKPVKQKKRNSKQSSKTSWIVHYSLPVHEVAPEKSVEAISATVAAATRITAKTRCNEHLISHLLYSTDQQVIKDFIEFATPVKRKILQEISAAPVISLSETLVAEAESLFNDLEVSNAFQVSSSRISLVSQPEDSFDSHGRKIHHVPSTAHPKSSWRTTNTDPKAIVVPSELARSKDLPMYSYFANVMAAIDNNPVVVISASTGAGKTTQLPQFILAYFKSQKDSLNKLSKRNSSAGKHGLNLTLTPPNVIVTQPRRIAAISVAQRVAKERGETMGRDSAIGYTVRFNSVTPKSDPADGHVVFCTSGILLKRLQDDPDLKDVTHVILDEVHERDLNTDLLLIIVRQLVQRRSDLKVILMSATADTSLFVKYFAKVNHNVSAMTTFKPSPAPVPFSSTKYRAALSNLATPFLAKQTLPPPPIITVPGRIFPVKEFHLEEVVKLLDTTRKRLLFPSQKYINSELNYEPPRYASSMYTNPNSGMPDYFPVDIYEALLAHITRMRGPGAILVFLPGWQEISLLMQKLKEDSHNIGFGDPSRVKLYALHSSVSSSGQEEVFERPRDGVRKIILSTNIAETSVTINDIVYVVDSGKIRINTYDPTTRLSSLNCVVASQSNLKQRSGRAGRCQPGEYYSLISKHHRESLPYNIPPELLRVDLQATALKIKSLNLSPFTAEVLALAPQPPATQSVEKALRDLHTLGALVTTKAESPNTRNFKKSVSKYRRDQQEDSVETLTPLGKALAHIPMDPWLAKMIILGTAFKVLDPILTSATILESGTRGVYAIHPDERERARLHILNKFACGRSESYGSDLLAAVTAYWDWKKAPSQAGLKKWDFAERNYLSNNGLMNVDRAKDQVFKALQDLRIIDRGDGRSRRNAIDNFDNESETSADLVPRVAVEELFGGKEVNGYSGNTDLVRALISASLFPNVAEAREKNMYGSPLDFKLKLTGSTMNSYSSLQMIEDAKSHPNRSLSFEEQVSRTTTSSEANDGDEDSPLDDDSTIDLQVPIVPPRFLSYHTKQMLEGAVWLRTTTIAEPMGLLLFASFGEHEARLNWIQSTDGKWVALMGGWLRVEFADEKSKVVVERLRGWVSDYLMWTVDGNKGKVSVETEKLVGRLIQLVSRLVVKQ